MLTEWGSGLRMGIVTLTLDVRPEALYYARARITSCVGHTFPDPRQQMLRGWINYYSHFYRLFAKTADADRKVAASRGLPRAQVALAWLLSKPVITAPIVGATKGKHLDDAIASVEVKLSGDEILALEEPYVPHAVVGFV
jgi:aryl-alcohol dehydrogenase-like predicted oxidoreductase